MNTSLIYFTKTLLRQKKNAEQGKLRALPFFFLFFGVWWSKFTDFKGIVVSDLSTPVNCFQKFDWFILSPRESIWLLKLNYFWLERTTVVSISAQVWYHIRKKLFDFQCKSNNWFLQVNTERKIGLKQVNRSLSLTTITAARKFMDVINTKKNVNVTTTPAPITRCFSKFTSCSPYVNGIPIG